MIKKIKNKSLGRAKSVKEDEFYTKLIDIENELKHYTKHLKNKIVYCNCDDPRVSNFFYYFSRDFKKLSLKKVIASCYKNQNDNLFNQNKKEKAVYFGYKSDKDKNIRISHLKGNGDFRSQECIELLKQADIVVTNPPFSLFREYVSQLIKYNKKFLIIGNINAITYKEIYNNIKKNKLWLGYKSGSMTFKVPDNYQERESGYKEDKDGQKWISLGNICWFTNLDISKRNKDIILTKAYKEENYYRYDNYNAINIDKIVDMPMDYKGVMGVPITFLDKYNPEQFEIIGYWSGGEAGKNLGAKRIKATSNGRIVFSYGPVVKGKIKYFRILIKLKEKC